MLCHSAAQLLTTLLPAAHLHHCPAHPSHVSLADPSQDCPVPQTHVLGIPADATPVLASGFQADTSAVSGLAADSSVSGLADTPPDPKPFLGWPTPL